MLAALGAQSAAAARPSAGSADTDRGGRHNPPRQVVDEDTLPGVDQGQSLWVWQHDDPGCLLQTADDYGVKRLSIWVAPGFTADPALVASLTELREAALTDGIAVDALSGDPSWVDTPQVAVSWAREVRSSGIFDRLHLDVEPHAHPDWDTRGAELRKDMLTMLRKVTAVAPVDVDIPSWYHQVVLPSGERFDSAVMRLASEVTVMAYRDNAADVLALAAPSMRTASTLGTEARIGIDTGEPVGEPPWTSYYGQSADQIRGDVGVIAARAVQWESFRGVALHHHGSLPGAGCATGAPPEPEAG